MSIVSLLLIGLCLLIARAPLARWFAGEWSPLFQGQELTGIASLVGFTLFVLSVWTAFTLLSEDATSGDPLGIIVGTASLLKLHPQRFPEAFVLVIATIACTLGAYATWSSTIALKATGIRVIGQVGELQATTSRLNDGSTGRGWFPEIFYRDNRGVDHQFTGSSGWPIFRKSEGDPIKVIYPPERPQDGMIDSWFDHYFPPLFFSFMAPAFFLLLFRSGGPIRRERR